MYRIDYFRFNVGEGGAVKLEAYWAIEKLAELADTFLSYPDTKNKLRVCAQALKKVCPPCCGLRCLLTQPQTGNAAPEAEQLFAATTTTGARSGGSAAPPANPILPQASTCVFVIALFGRKSNASVQPWLGAPSQA